MSTLESERTDSQLKVSKAENTIMELKESLPSSNGVELKIEKCDAELKELLEKIALLGNQITEKNSAKDDIQLERDELVKKSLMILNSTMKK